MAPSVARPQYPAQSLEEKQKRKAELVKTIALVQRSTASLGRFDEKLPDEDKIVKIRKVKRKVRRLSGYPP